MTYRGHVKNGCVQLDAPLDLPDGTTVSVRPLKGSSRRSSSKPPKTAPTTWGRTLLKYAGKAKGLPADLARNHDHYIHGVPKK